MTERDVVTTIDSWDEVPAFASEAEEAAYWQTHGPSERLLETFGPIDDALPRPRIRRRPPSEHPWQDGGMWDQKDPACAVRGCLAQPWDHPGYRPEDFR